MIPHSVQMFFCDVWETGLAFSLSRCLPLSTLFRHEFISLLWQPLRVAKKNLRFNIRMSDEQRAELEEMCRRRGRPLSFQVEHLIALAKLRN